MDLSVGDQLGSYTIEKLLGAGGMGKVYLAQDHGLKRPAAIKILRKNYADNPTYRRRFHREAQAIARLKHPNIVQIYHVDVACDTPYMAMEYIKGLPLDFFMKQHGKLSWQKALTVTAQVASALACTHSKGIIHRDIKPSNILVDEKLGVHVTDFGIAKVLDAQTKMTAPQDTIGTPCYMSPEQCGVGKVVPASDIFSLGVTLFEMLAGQLPLVADTSMGMMNKIVSEQPPSIENFVPDLPPMVPQFLATLMAKKVEDRYSDASQILEDLNAFRAGKDATHLTMIRQKGGGDTGTVYELAVAEQGLAVQKPNLLEVGKEQALVGDLMDIHSTEISARPLYVEKPPIWSYWPSWATWLVVGAAALVGVSWFINSMPERRPAPPVAQPPREFNPPPQEQPFSDQRLTPDGNPWPLDPNGNPVPARGDGYPEHPPGRRGPGGGGGNRGGGGNGPGGNGPDGNRRPPPPR